MVCCTEEALKVMGKDKQGEGGGVIIATASVTGNNEIYCHVLPTSGYHSNSVSVCPTDIVAYYCIGHCFTMQ